MDYEMEELVPIVGKLAEAYTGFDSTSITYEKAQQLMEAVLYCIHELKENGESQLAAGPGDRMPASLAYKAGAELVKAKTRDGLERYSEILNEFNDYGNRCLSDTFRNGLSEFFRRYDPVFAPHYSILTLDYPVLRDLSGYEGIDKIYEFIRCIGLEQKFLRPFGGEMAETILLRNRNDYREMIDNVCQIVFTAVMGSMLAGKSVGHKLEQHDYENIRELSMDCQGTELLEKIARGTEALVREYYGGDKELLAYLEGTVRGIEARIRNGVRYGGLWRIF